jgi:hypothetical protein
MRYTVSSPRNECAPTRAISCAAITLGGPPKAHRQRRHPFTFPHAYFLTFGSRSPRLAPSSAMPLPTICGVLTISPGDRIRLLLGRTSDRSPAADSEKPCGFMPRQLGTRDRNRDPESSVVTNSIGVSVALKVSSPMAAIRRRSTLADNRQNAKLEDVSHRERHVMK